MKPLLKIIFIIFFPFMIGIGNGIHLNTDDREVLKKDHALKTTYPEHIAGAYTGGFGEESCRSCHFDYDLNQAGGELSVNGIPDSFKSGQEYTIQIIVEREDLNRAGFQMTSRFEDSTQAGSFQLPDNLTTTPNIDNKITYVQHGVGKVDAEGGEKNWQVTWTAPEQTGKSVIFNIAGNAANGDASEFGDWIYVKEIRTEPSP